MTEDRFRYEATPDLPDGATFGPVTYSAPAWAFENRLGKPARRAEVSWPGRLAKKPNPYIGVELFNEPVVEGESAYAPGDSFYDLHVGTGYASLTYAIPVNTFGTLVKCLVREDKKVRPGDALFLFDARPPTTAEWWDLRERLRAEEGEAGGLRRVLHGGPVAVARWLWAERRASRPAVKQRRREGRQALKDWKAEERQERRNRGS